MYRAFLGTLILLFATSVWAIEIDPVKPEPDSTNRKVPSDCAETPIVLTYSDGSKLTFQSYEQAYEAIVNEVRKDSDGRIVVSMEEHQIVITKTRDTVRIEDGDRVDQKSVEAYLTQLLEARDEARRATCNNNVRSIQNAILLWSQDHDPETLQSLNQLTPYYLQSLPSCPFSGTDTYSKAFLTKPETRLQCSSEGCRRD